MTLETLMNAKTLAMKAGDADRRQALTNMIDNIQKAAITSKGRVEITEQLVDEVLIKYQKTVQEMIDTCPADRVSLLGKYQAEMEVVKEYAPKLMTDPAEIKAMIFTITSNAGIELVKTNKGPIMKTITPYFKGKADMKIVNQVVGEILN